MDEDEQDAAPEDDALGGMEGMGGGMGGMPGMEGLGGLGGLGGEGGFPGVGKIRGTPRSSRSHKLISTDFSKLGDMGAGAGDLGEGSPGDLDDDDVRSPAQFPDNPFRPIELI